jgi:hypothetical protein
LLSVGGNLKAKSKIARCWVLRRSPTLAKTARVGHPVLCGAAEVKGKVKSKSECKVKEKSEGKICNGCDNFVSKVRVFE